MMGVIDSFIHLFIDSMSQLINEQSPPRSPPTHHRHNGRAHLSIHRDNLSGSRDFISCIFIATTDAIPGQPGLRLRPARAQLSGHGAMIRAAPPANACGVALIIVFDLA